MALRIKFETKTNTTYLADEKHQHLISTELQKKEK